MKRGKHLPCPNCRAAWVPVAPDAPNTAVLCTSCQPHPTRLQVALNRVYEAIHRRRARLTVGVVYALLAVVMVASWAAVAWAR